MLFCCCVPAFHEGDSTTVALLVMVDGATVVEDWISSGTTLGFQTISLAGYSSESVTLIADTLAHDDYLSITEVRDNSINRKQISHCGLMPPIPNKDKERHGTILDI